MSAYTKGRQIRPGGWSHYEQENDRRTALISGGQWSPREAVNLEKLAWAEYKKQRVPLEVKPFDMDNTDMRIESKTNWTAILILAIAAVAVVAYALST